MGLADELAAEVVEHPIYGPRCPVARVFAIMEEGDADVLSEALSDRERFTAKQIARVLERRGLPVAESAIQRHRRGSCKCVPVG